MVNAEGSAVTRAGVGEMSISELRNGEWQKRKRANGKANSKKTVEPLSAIRYFPIRFPLFAISHVAFEPRPACFPSPSRN
jgi:hypothetical protein